ncbi:hypothetical protein IWQ55_000285 [Labrenzia sp. EL_208]|nr:hypothetical protein [Labrenzia sp. EL_132]MBG6227093.1 hypothetical protein [Labrenzia sp. EL_208]
MPTKSGSLTRPEQRYVENRGKGLDPVEAAKQAGYSNPHAAVARLEDTAVIVKQIRTRQATWLKDEAHGLAQSVVISVLSDSDAKNTDRLKAAELVFKEIRGLVDEGDRLPGDQPMTLSDLQARIDELKRMRTQAESDLIDVTPEPVDPLS